MAKIHFQLVTPERTLLNQELDSLSCPSKLGQLTILPNHIPLVANLVPGELIARSEGKENYVYVTGGFIEIRPHNQVIVLADAAEHHYEIDEQQAQEALRRAKKAMAETKRSAEEYAAVAASLEKSLVRLHVARKRAHTRTAPITGEGVLKE
ncbi:MAG: ATP synthase F1 subunit epsilon [Patescibacteria group bacterium]|nr:ATP synthase F1 subunit epsilon [Patescibacteria group bacterium]